MLGKGPAIQRNLECTAFESKCSRPYNEKGTQLHYILQSQSGKQKRNAVHEKRIIGYNGYNNSSFTVMKIGYERPERNVLRCTYRDTIVSGLTISGHLKHISLDEDDEKELEHFSIAIC